MAASSASGEKRTYHATKSAYVLPNDNTEHQRLEEQAERLLELFGDKVIHAPLDAHCISKILETGCGTGTTTNEFGAMFPRASVYGVDLSPVPAVRPERENIAYIQGDILELAAPGGDARLAEHSFDYVFSRALVAGMNKWDEYFKLCVTLAKPGGWVEMHEPDITLHLTPPASGNVYDKYSRAPSLEMLKAEIPSVDRDPESWRAALGGLFRARGLEPDIGSQLPKRFEDAGLEDIRIERYIFPYGSWEGMTDVQRRFTSVNERFLRHDAPALLGKLAMVTGAMSDEDVATNVEAVREFLTRYSGNREFSWIYVVCGRKPRSG